MQGDPEQKLIINLSRIPDEGIEINHEMPRQWLDNIPEFSGEEGPHIEGSMSVSGRLSKEGRNLRLKGAVKAELATVCARCGAEIRCPLEGRTDIIMQPGPPAELPEEVELSFQDMNRSFYQGEEVDLNPFFKEMVALEVPIQPLCRRDCKGLCPRCGADRNYEQCTCDKVEPDPRLQKIQELKIEEK